ncbi:MAG: hypothetical protein HOD39_03865 [Verrucomicrobia bacterium]|nr:hypothetical protein [Verrucomicrobiota bacterium]MBT5479874.1 hypothetical protein [Verrucomicrobiota bacterium]
MPNRKWESRAASLKQVRWRNFAEGGISRKACPEPAKGRLDALRCH